MLRFSTIIIGAILILLIGGGLILYFLGDRPASTGAPAPAGPASEIFPVSAVRNIPFDEGSSFGPETELAGSESSPLGISGLRRLKTGAVAGARFASSTSVVYVEKESGNLFELEISKETPRRLSNTTFSRTQEVYWGKDKSGLRVIFRREDDGDVENLSGFVRTRGTSTNEVGELVTRSLPQFLTVAVSPKGDSFFMLEKSSSVVLGSVSAFDLKKTSVFSSPFREWAASWPEARTIALQTKPASNVAGYLYFLDPQTKNFKKVLGGIRGLTALVSPDAKSVLYGESQGDGLAVHVADLTDRTSRELRIPTLPEKCAWAADSKKLYCAVPDSIPLGRYPEEWYSGEKSFEDSLWEIDLETLEGKQLFDPGDLGRNYEIDGLSLELSPSGEYLLFVNKIDSSLWIFDLRRG